MGSCDNSAFQVCMPCTLQGQLLFAIAFPRTSLAKDPSLAKTRSIVLFSATRVALIPFNVKARNLRLFKQIRSQKKPRLLY